MMRDYSTRELRAEIARRAGKKKPRKAGPATNPRPPATPTAQDKRSQ